MDNEPRVLRGERCPRSVSPRLLGAAHTRPANYKSWSEESMTKALDAVSRREMSIREASERFNVPRSTLGDRASGRVQHGSTSGPNRYLTSGEERELASFVIRCASIGFPKTRHEVISLVQSIVDSKHIDTVVSSGWWQAFCKRNPTVTLRAPAPLSKARAHATDPELISRYYDLLEETLTQHDLQHKPCQIYNMDETGLPLNPKSVKCVYKKGEKNPLAPCSGDKSQITVVTCVSAGGSTMPPLVIIKRKKNLPSYYKVGEVPGTKYGLSERGWIDRGLFREWFQFLFLRFLPAERPVLLLMDGHSSHFCPDTIRLAAEQDVIIFVLPPNATHLLQPLDKGTFGPLKTYWREECHHYMTRNPGEHVTKYVFSEVFSKAWDRCMTPSNVRAGFKVTGVCPFNRNAAQKMVKSGVYLPMLSPALECEHRGRHRADSESELESRGRRGRHCADSESEPESRGRRGRHCADSESEPESRGRRGRHRADSESEPENCGRRGRHRADSESEPESRGRRGRHRADYQSEPESRGRRGRHRADYQSEPESRGCRGRHRADSESEPESRGRRGRHRADSESEPESRGRRGRHRADYQSEPESRGRRGRHRADSESEPVSRGRRGRHRADSESEPESRGRRGRHRADSESEPESRGRRGRHRADYQSEPESRGRRGRHRADYQSEPESRGCRGRHRADSESEPESRGRRGRHRADSESEPVSRGRRGRHRADSESEPESRGRRGRHRADSESEPESRGRRGRHRADSESEPESRGRRGRHRTVQTAYDFDSKSGGHYRSHCKLLTDCDSDPTAEKPQSMIYCSQTKQFLKTPRPRPKVKTDKIKSSGRILTSLENIKLMEAKEKEKAEKAKLKQEKEAKRLAKKSSRMMKKPKNSGTEQLPATQTFTSDELKLFTQRLENGYDLKHDERYNQWLKENHPARSGGGTCTCIAFVF